MPQGRFCWLTWRCLIVVAGVAALAGLGWSWPVLVSWGPMRWVATSAEFRQGLVVVGPAAMICAAWVARLRRTAACGPTPGRGWAVIVRHQLGGVCLAVSVGFVVGLLPLVVRTAVQASSGWPSVLVILSGLALLNACAALGFLLGAVVPSPYSYAVCVVVALLVFVGAANAVWIVNYGGSNLYAGLAEAPWWPHDVWASFGQHEAGLVAAYRTVWAAAFGLGFAWLAGRLDQPLSGRGVVQRLRDLLVALVVPAALIGAGVLWHPIAVVDDDPLPARCASTTQGVQVCVPADVAALLPTAQQEAQRIFDAVGTAQWAGPLGPKHLVYENPQAGPSSYAVGIAQSIVGLLTTGPTAFPCGASVDDPVTDAGMAAEAVQATLIGRLANLSYTPTGAPTPSDSPAARLDAVSDADLKAWLDTHGAALRACQVGTADLP